MMGFVGGKKGICCRVVTTFWRPSKSENVNYILLPILMLAIQRNLFHGNKEKVIEEPNHDTQYIGSPWACGIDLGPGNGRVAVALESKGSR